MLEESLLLKVEDAYRCFETDMDYLVLGNKLLDKKTTSFC